MTNDRGIETTSGSLTALERELLTYVERLVIASESSERQFAELEKRSTGLIMERQAALELGPRSVIASLRSLVEASSLSDFEPNGSEDARRRFDESRLTLIEAESRLTSD